MGTQRVVLPHEFDSVKDAQQMKQDEAREQLTSDRRVRQRSKGPGFRISSILVPQKSNSCITPTSSKEYKAWEREQSAVGSKLKECRTRFERTSTNGTTSIVKCMPFTGRTHQIRVHLQYLGELFVEHAKCFGF